MQKKRLAAASLFSKGTESRSVFFGNKKHKSRFCRVYANRNNNYKGDPVEFNRFRQTAFGYKEKSSFGKALQLSNNYYCNFTDNMIY